MPSTVGIYHSANNDPRGLRFNRYTGYYNDNPSWFATATVTHRNRGANLDAFGMKRLTNGVQDPTQQVAFSLEFVGFFRSHEAGTYWFYATSDDSSFIWIGDTARSGYTTGNAVTQNPGGHAPLRRTGAVTLAADTFYPIRIQMGSGYGGPNQLFLSMEIPGVLSERFDFTGFLFFRWLFFWCAS